MIRIKKILIEKRMEVYMKLGSFQTVFSLSVPRHYSIASNRFLGRSLSKASGMLIRNDMVTNS